MLGSIFSLMLGAFNHYLLALKIMGERLNYSKYPFIRKYKTKIVDVIGAAGFCYMLGAFVYVLSELFVRLFKLFKFVFDIFIYSKVNTEYTEELLKEALSMLPNVDWLLVVKLCTLMIVLTFTWIMINFRNQSFRLTAEFHVLYSISSIILKNFHFGKRGIVSFVFFMASTIALTFFILPEDFFLANIQIVLLFWVAIYVVIYVYGNMADISIDTKKFVLFFAIILFTVYYIYFNGSKFASNATEFTYGFITFFLAIDRFSNQYKDYRKKLFEGVDIQFVIGVFSKNDYDTLNRKLKLHLDKDVELYDNPRLVGMIYFNMTDPNFDFAKSCFEESIRRDSKDHISKYYLAQILIDNVRSTEINENDTDNLIHEAIRLLEEAKLYQTEKGFDGLQLIDIDYLIAIAKFHTCSPDYEEVLKLLENSGNGYVVSDYYRAGCMLNLNPPKLTEAEKILKRINYDDGFQDIPFLLATIEVMKEHTDFEALNLYISEAQKFEIDCSVVIDQMNEKLIILEQNNGSKV